MRRSLIATRVLVALLVIAAIVVQLRSSITFAKGGSTGNVLINFFSYFTVDSNAISAVVLLLGARVLLRDRPESRTFTTVRLSVVTYMTITGVVYNLLLRGLLTQGATVPWSNEVLHVVAPVYLLLDWLLAPGRRPLSSRQALPVLVFPAVWIIWTLVRGPFAHDPYRDLGHWYPYPFIDPVASSGGYASVAAYVVGIAVVTLMVALAMAWTTRRGGSRPA